MLFQSLPHGPPSHAGCGGHTSTDSGEEDSSLEGEILHASKTTVSTSKGKRKIKLEKSLYVHYDNKIIWHEDLLSRHTSLGGGFNLV